MEPYATKAGQMYHVRGARGEDPTETARQRAVPAPCGDPRTAPPAASRRPGAAGYHPFHSSCGIMLDEQRMPFSACSRCKDCDGFPCLVHAKSDAQVLGMRPAPEYGRDPVGGIAHARV